MKNILILHIPKTGGNSLQNYFSKLEGFNSYSIGHNINNCKNGGDIKLFVNGKCITKSKIDNLSNFFKITIIRNPYDRIVSQYKFNVTTLKKNLKMFELAKSKYNKNLNKLGFKIRKKIFCEIFDDWQTEDNKINSKTLQKKDFYINELDKLENLGFKNWVKKYGKINNYKYNKYVEKADYVIKFENMNDDIKILKEKLKINNNLEFPHLIKSNRKPNYHEYYDIETKELVYDLFKEDIDNYDYNF